MAKLGQGVALDPPGAKPLDLKYMKTNGFPKAVGLLETHAFQCHELQGLGPSREAALGTWWGLRRSRTLGFKESSFT